MSTFRLKRKNFASILSIGDQVVSGANAGKRSQSYYDSLDWGDPKKVSNKDLINSNKGIKVGSDQGTRNLGGQTVYNKTPRMSTQQVAQSSFNRGQASVGIKQGAMNTWNRMGKMGKAGTIAAGATGAYLLGKGLFGGKKKD